MSDNGKYEEEGARPRFVKFEHGKVIMLATSARYRLSYQLVSLRKSHSTVHSFTTCPFAIF